MNIFKNIYNYFISNVVPFIKEKKIKIIKLGNFLSKKIKLLFQNGGLKLKLIGSAVVIILFTIISLSSIIINLMKSSIEQKAIEVATTSIERIADFSTHALLERSYENYLTLNEMIKEIKLSKAEGILDISIYAYNKTEQDTTFNYSAGFENYKKGTQLNDEKIVKRLETTTSNDVMYDTSPFINKRKKEINSYRFVKPIIYTFKKKNILLGVAILYYDKKAITGVIENVIYISVLITLAIIIFTIILTYFAGSRFTRPILSIAQAATDVSSGNLDIHLQISSNDEIGLLADRFNNMVKDLREKEKMKMFISDSTIDMIQDDSKSKLVLGGEYRSLTFLFSDIRGFTAMSETKEPEEVVNIINFYLHLQSEIIKTYGGDIDKFVGDEIMVSFSGEDGIDRAFKTAIAIQDSIAKENSKRNKNNETVCHVGIGINQGKVIVGNIGSNGRMDFTSIGSTVNIASRLCSNAAAGQILIAQPTFDMAKDNYDTQLIDPIVVKGISKPININSITTPGA